MGTIEFDKCDFCQEEKPVWRTYLRADIIKENFTFVKYCNDCGEPKNLNVDNVTRFEVIDHTFKNKGRVLVEYDVRVEISIQDEGRTMKVFLTEKQ